MTPLDNIGRLDQRVVLETQDPTAHLAHGGRADAPITAIEVWAGISHSRAAARETDDRRSIEEIIEVTLRWRADVTRDTDVLWRSKRYRVLTIEPLGMPGDWLLLRCAHHA